MKTIIKYKKKSLNFLIKINKQIFIKWKLLSKKNYTNISLKTYNYLIIAKILRNFGLLKPLINIKKF